MGLTFATPNGGNSKKTGNKNKNNSKANKKTSSYKAPSGHPSAGGYTPKAVTPKAANPKAATPKAATPKAVIAPRHRDAYVAPKAKVTPKVSKPSASVIESTAKTTPLASPKITSTAGSIAKTAPKAAAPVMAIKPVADKGMDSREKAYEAPAAPIPKPITASKPVVDKGMDRREKAYVKPAAPKVVTPVVKSAAINISKDNKTVAEVPKYDQKYWAGKLAEGKAGGNKDIQGDLKKEMDSVGMKKAYSGDKVITEDMKRKAADDLKRVTGSMATLENGGVTKTEKTSGLLGEKLDTTYDYKGGPSIVTKANDPSLLGVNFGKKTSTTFVDGVEVATKTGRDPLGYDAKVTKPDIAGHIDDTQAIDPAKAKEEITSIDEQIKTETDPVKLKALHKRRLMLMRMNNTNTKFAGLLNDADTKRSNLMSIS
tara:strand:- start:729 stop:2012 length:1284 start_codon:yes stop_codon:yes gene_type:complete